MFTKTRAKALVQQLDTLIEKYSESNPELLADLQAHRAAVQDAIRRDSALDFAKAALRISVWVKFIYDHWPGD